VSTARSSAFARRVLAIVRRIPPGSVATYGDIAELAGRPRAARAVGNIMRAYRAPGAASTAAALGTPPAVPCHRVVAAGGRLGGYCHPLLKISLLGSEGIIVSGSRIRDFSRVRWRPNQRRGAWYPAPGARLFTGNAG